jgi:hypothetical protein
MQSCTASRLGPPIQNPLGLKLPPSCGMSLAARCRLPGCTESHIGCSLTLTGRAVDRPNRRCAAHVPTAFLAASARTKLHNDANGSIRQASCVGTARNGPYTAASIAVCTTSSSSARRTHTSLINTNRDNIF